MSQPRSSRGAKSGAGRARGGSRSQAVSSASRARRIGVAEAKSDIFVVLLGVALGAMVIGCLFLVLKLNQYGFSAAGPGGI